MLIPFSSITRSDGPAALLLHTLLSSHLQHRTLLPGSLVLLPVLGHRLVLQVTSTGQDPPDPVAVQASTQLRMHAAEQAPGQHASVVQRAADAAAAAVGGGPDGAAARSAAAAVTAGASLLRATAASKPFEAVAGMGTQLAMLQRLVVKPLTDPAATRALGVGAPCGVLLHGPPGTGKSLLCRAAAAAARAVLFVLHGPDVLTGVLGDSEAGMRGTSCTAITARTRHDDAVCHAMCTRAHAGVFAAAIAMQPSVILLEELDALAPARRGPGATGALGTVQRVVTALLGAMDALDGRDMWHVCH